MTITIKFFLRISIQWSKTTGKIMRIYRSVKSGEVAWRFCQRQHIPTSFFCSTRHWNLSVSQLLLHSQAVVKIAKSARSLLCFTPSERGLYLDTVHVPDTPRDEDGGSQADTCSTLKLCQRFSGLCTGVWEFLKKEKEKIEKCCSQFSQKSKAVSSICW